MRNTIQQTPAARLPHFLETPLGRGFSWVFSLSMLTWLVALFCDVPYLNGVLP